MLRRAVCHATVGDINIGVHCKLLVSPSSSSYFSYLVVVVVVVVVIVVSIPRASITAWHLAVTDSSSSRLTGIMSTYWMIFLCVIPTLWLVKFYFNFAFNFAVRYSQFICISIPSVPEQRCRICQLALSITVGRLKMSTNTLSESYKTVLSSNWLQLSDDIVSSTLLRYRVKSDILNTHNECMSLLK